MQHNTTVTPTVPSTPEIKTRWDTFAKCFQESFEPSANITAYSLISSLNIGKEQPKRILDLGCGAGGGSFLIGVTQHPESHLTCMDLSSEMIELAKETCQPITKPPLNRNIDFMEGNAECLPFESDTFDVVLSNYCLHLVADPDAVLSEVLRVLKKGGRAFWGSPEFTQMTIIQQSVAECKKEWGMTDIKPPTRSPFHLNDKNQLVQRAQRAGFSKYLTWYQYQPFHTSTAEEFTKLQMGTPDIVNFLSNVSHEQVMQFKNKMESLADNFYSKGEIIGNEVLILLVTK